MNDHELEDHLRTVLRAVADQSIAQKTPSSVVGIEAGIDIPIAELVSCTPTRTRSRHRMWAAGLALAVASSIVVITIANAGPRQRSLVLLVPRSVSHRHADPSGRGPSTYKMTPARRGSSGATPSTVDFVSSLPNCVPVSDRGGKTRGCIDKKYFYGFDGGPPPLPAGQPGVPVVSGPNGTLTGYAVPAFGFVGIPTAQDPVKFKTLIDCAAPLATLKPGVTFDKVCIDAFAAQGLTLPAEFVAG